MADRVNAVVFDLDGTLTDTIDTITTSRWILVRELARSTGIDEGALVAKLGPLIVDDIHNPDVMPRLDVLSTWAGSDESRHAVLAECQRRFHDALVALSVPMPGVCELLDELSRRGIRKTIWSNKRACYTVGHLQALGFDDGRFDAVYCPDSPDHVTALTPVVQLPHQERKPQRRTLYRILQEQGYSADTTLLVGNNLRNDGGATVGTGVRFVWADLGCPAPRTLKALTALTGPSRHTQATAERYADFYEVTRDVAPVARITSSLLEVLKLLED